MNLNDFKFSSDIHLKRIFVSIRVMKVQWCYVLFVARSICTSLYTSQSFERREECSAVTIVLLCSLLCICCDDDITSTSYSTFTQFHSTVAAQSIMTR